MKTQEILEKLEIYQPRGWKEICVFISKQAAQLAAAEARALPELPLDLKLTVLFMTSAQHWLATLTDSATFTESASGTTPAEAIRNAVAQIKEQQ